jgi:hypothetical protein
MGASHSSQCQPRAVGQLAARALDRIFHGRVDLVLCTVAGPSGRHRPPPCAGHCRTLSECGGRRRESSHAAIWRNALKQRAWPHRPDDASRSTFRPRDDAPRDACSATDGSGSAEETRCAGTDLSSRNDHHGTRHTRTSSDGQALRAAGAHLALGHPDQHALADVPRTGRPSPGTRIGKPEADMGYPRSSRTSGANHSAIHLSSGNPMRTRPDLDAL